MLMAASSCLCRRALPAMFAAVFSLQGGCSSRASDEAAIDANSKAIAGFGGSSSALGETTPSQKLVFESTDLDKIPVLGERTLAVRLAPARPFTVTFALIGDSLDASLASTQVTTDASGLAEVVITASSLPTTFTVRASAGRTAAAEAKVTVIDALTGSLDITASYTGNRHADSYSISAHPNKECSSLSSNSTTTEGISIATAAMPARLEGIPLATPLALVVIGDNALMRGCVMLRGVTERTPVAVNVPLSDMPLDFREVELDVTLLATDQLQGLRGQLTTTIAPLVTALGSGGHDLTDLLTAMASVARGSLQQEFATQRDSSDWDTVVKQIYDASGGADLLRRQLLSWLNQGVTLLSTQPNLKVRLALGPTEYSTPRLELLSLADIDNTDDRLMESVELTLKPEANDWLNWSSKLSLSSANLLEQLALMASESESPGLGSLPAQLENRLDCAAFATHLNDSVVWSSNSSRECTTSCLETLCVSGLAEMYKRATSAVYGFRSEILLNASGQVSVDRDAKPLRMVGTWLGALDVNSNPTTVAGTYESQ